MKLTDQSSLREISFCVCSALDGVGVTAVLTGGSAATIYAPDAIQSFDLDLIRAWSKRAGRAEELQRFLARFETSGTL